MVIDLVQGSELLDKFREFTNLIENLGDRIKMEEGFIETLSYPSVATTEIKTEDGVFAVQDGDWIEVENGTAVCFWSLIAPRIRDYLV